MQKGFYTLINNEIESYFISDYYDSSTLVIDVDDYLPFEIDDIKWDKVVFESKIIDAYLKSQKLILVFSTNYLDSLRNTTKKEWESQLIEDKRGYYDSLF